MRSLHQPGPAHLERIACVRGTPASLRFRLRPGVSLNDAVCGPLMDAGFLGAAVILRNVALNPFRYVMPGPADDETHVAYFAGPVAPPGTSVVEFANGTFGMAGDSPLLHCHAAWTEPDGKRRGGHILVKEVIVTEEAEVEAHGFRDAGFTTIADAETNFTLYEPSGSGIDGDGLAVRVKPNEDILTAIETIAAAHGAHNAVVRGSVGSLIGPAFEDGTSVPDHATEVAVREGWVRGGVAALNLLVVDMRGEVHEGWLKRGENPVCITFDLVIEAVE